MIAALCLGVNLMPDPDVLREAIAYAKQNVGSGLVVYVDHRARVYVRSLFEDPPRNGVEVLRVLRMVNALCPSVRGEVCTHEHLSWTGSVPCTGQVGCSMCGMRWERMEDAKAAHSALA